MTGTATLTAQKQEALERKRVVFRLWNVTRFRMVSTQDYIVIWKVSFKVPAQVSKVVVLRFTSADVLIACVHGGESVLTEPPFLFSPRTPVPSDVVDQWPQARVV